MHLALIDIEIKHCRKEETIFTTARARATSSREPNRTRMVLLRLNTAYALEPHTATCKKERGKSESKGNCKSGRSV